MHTLFTIGHSNHAIGRFIELVTRHAVELVCDVRSNPYSRFNPQFNREALMARLEEHGIGYLFLGKELGGKPSDLADLTDDYDRFTLIAASERFRVGLERLLEEIKVRRTAVMCAEKDPSHCHRTFLVCRHIPEGIVIRHILADGSIREHAKLDPEGRSWRGRQKRLL